MLFNSAEYLFLFLPLTLVIFYFLHNSYWRIALGFLAFSSLFFYSYWNPKYLSVFFGSILVNFLFAKVLAKHSMTVRGKKILILCLAANLLLLAWYKYSAFVAWNSNALFGTNFSTLRHALPLGISFFTFQKIAFLVDNYQGPQLIAGTIVHHSQLMPQFTIEQTAFKWSNISYGLTYLTIGLAKKCLLADSLAPYANRVFQATDHSLHTPALIEAWLGTLAYTFQLYFDFSGYSDMAIGSALFFGIALPINFNSPYQSLDIAQFWRRWHMTLSAFLRDYVYIPLGGNRNGAARTNLNLMMTMLIGGLWHGAGWNFIIWGGLHGTYLLVHRSLGLRVGFSKHGGQILTFLSVCVAWVFFRAETLNGALEILQGMVGLNGLKLPLQAGVISESFSTYTSHDWKGLIGDLWVMPFLIGLALIAFFAPNTQDIMTQLRSGKWRRFESCFALATGLVFALCLYTFASGKQEFLYFEF